MAIFRRFLFSANFFLYLLCLSTTTLLQHEAFAITTVHDLLPQFGFPKGLIPDAVNSYSLSDSGDFEIDLERQCYVHFDNIVFYDKKIKGKLKYGVISDVSGIQAKKMFVWVSVTGIEVDSDLGFLEFYVGFLSEKLPIEQFERIPKCKSKACGRRERFPEPEEEEEEVSLISEV